MGRGDARTLADLTDLLELSLSILESGQGDVELKDLHACGDGWVTNSLLQHTRYLASKVARAHAQLLADALRGVVRDALVPTGRLRGLGSALTGPASRVAGMRWAIEALGSKEEKAGTRLESTRLISTARPPGLETRVQLFYLDLLEATLSIEALAQTRDLPSIPNILAQAFYWLTEADRRVPLSSETFSSFLKSTLYAIFLLQCLRPPASTTPSIPSSVTLRTTHYLLSLLGRVRIFAVLLTAWLGTATKQLVDKTISMVPASAYAGATDEGPGNFRPVLPLLDLGVGPLLETWAEIASRAHPQAPEVLRRTELVPFSLPPPPPSIPNTDEPEEGSKGGGSEDEEDES